MRRFVEVPFRLATARLALVATMIGLGSLAAAPFAKADIEVVPGTLAAGAFAQGGVTPDTQAGGHPFEASVEFELKTFTEEGWMYTDEHVKDIVAQLPAGFVGNPMAAPKCSRAQFNETVEGKEGACPVASQIGIARIGLVAASEISYNNFPVFNVEPQNGELADFGIPVYFVAVHAVPSVRSSGDRGITITARDTSSLLALAYSKVTLWGVPSDPRHDPLRRCSDGFAYGCSSPIPQVPFLTTPATCEAPPRTGLVINSWTRPDVLKAYSTTSPRGTGCDRLKFEPRMSVTPDSKRAGAPTGFSAHIELPQNENPDGLSPPPLKKVRVVLPAGMSVNSATADGLEGCSDAQLGLDNEAPISCPESAKIGTVSAVSPALEDPIEGSVYLRSQASDDPESGQMFRMALALESKERGLLLKQAGEVRVNKETGQIETVFDSNPQLPVSAIDLKLKSGARAPLVNPANCGTYTTHAELSGWSKPNSPVSSESSFTIDEGCEASSRFTPGLVAGTANPVAGSFSAFTLRLTGLDGQPNVSAIEATLPKGLLAKLKGIPYCPEAQAAGGECPAASQVGTATVGAGSGSNPIYVPQPGKAPTAIYLAGPYKGAPLSIVVKVPAQAGPFDLGTVAVRNALHIDPSTAQVTAKSDPLPQIIAGVPISYRDIRVEMDRPDFILNPTSCEPMAVTSSIASVGGLTASPSSRFQAADCADLGFKPKLSLRLSGAPPRRGGYPKLTATLTMPKGGANIRKAVVTMPETEFLENAHIRTVCTRVQYAADQCPKGSVYGYAKAWTPLLDEPLQGPVYLRSSSNTLPDLVASLDGQIHVDLAGRIDSVDARLRSTFWAVPDAPVSKFQLTMQGGRKGLLVNNTNLCATTPRADARFTGQNGKVANGSPKVKVTGCGKKQRK